ncbi:hypothetical protein KY092_20465 [Natronomonas gomsonensis]|uniref:hypothetical protein n=1 Tax=Natronomonas gomsonensis TaxID=1046043 RepID=UPI00227B60E3|nr:hypothetical protein [Natronomonas gomsonensis]MCY4732906.1 hypothetical protein [Natronomonas gomsonensis]
MTRRRLLAATTAVSLGIVSGCTTSGGTAEAPPAEETDAVPATGDETNSDAPVTESTDVTNSDTTDTAEPEPEPALPPEVNDMYTREEFGVNDLDCGQISPYSEIIPHQGSTQIVTAGRWAEQTCEDFSFVREEYDEESRMLQLYVDWDVDGNEGCEDECARGKVLYVAYDVEPGMGIEFYLSEYGEEPELVESWWP